MEFDLDDPMDSDDSFFEEPKVLNKRTSLTKTPDKKSIESIFGLSEKSTLEKFDSKTPEKKSLESLFSTSEKNLKTDAEKTRPTVTFDESVVKVDFIPTQKSKDDWSNSDPSGILDKSVKKTDFLEDILSLKPKTSKSERKATSLEDILKESKVSSVAQRPSAQTKDIFTPTESTSDLGLMATSRERRRRRGSSTAIEDALGLFGHDYESGDFYANDKNIKPPDDVVKNKPLPDKNVPDWLGTSTTSLNKSDISNTNIEHIESTVVKPVEQVSTSIYPKAESLPPQLDPQKINTSIQNTYSSLHQQESFLLVSLQLKKYEESLLEIKNQQKELLGKQEKQFNTFLDEYILKQQMVENNVRLQQERINNQIQMLLSNPTGRTPNDANQEITKREQSNEAAQDFQNFIKSLNQRHNEEMFFMEESYKKQLSLLEASAIALEQKFKEEMTNMSQLFDEKLVTFKHNSNEEVDYYREKLKVKEEQHQEELKMIKINHSTIIDEIKNEHATQVEYIKQMKQREGQLLNNGNVISQRLESNAETLSNNTKVLQSMEEKLLQSYDVLSSTRENSLIAKEKEIILMRNCLEKCRESAELERSQLLAVVRNLEIKLAEQGNNAREDRWALQQASATLTARASAIEREAEFNRNSIERERQELKTLKESLLADQEKMVMQLTEEKLHFSTEKARWETSRKLAGSYENDRLKTEAETAIQVAKELMEKVNQERTQLQRQKNEMEILRRSFVDREKELNEKESELEILMRDAHRKLTDDKRVLKEAKNMENMYKERLQELQNQWITLSNREKKLAEEKVYLSKERLALYTATKVPKSCVLCKTDGNPAYETFVPIGSEDIVINKISDFDTIKFKADLFEDESVVSKEENNVSCNLK